MNYEKLYHGSGKEDLSSPFTFIFKFIIPVLWFGGIGLLALLIGVEDEISTKVFLTIYIAIGIIILIFLAPLKSVQMDDRYLYVSNLRKKIQVLLSKIERVRGIPTSGFHFIFIRFSVNTNFGSNIIFIADFDLGSVFFKEHPVVDLLRRRAGISSGIRNK